MAGDRPRAASASELAAVAFIERIGLLEPDLLEPLLSPEFQFHTMIRSSDLPLSRKTDRQAFLRFLVEARSLFPDKCPHEIKSILSSDDRVVIESECEALFSDGSVYSNAFSFHFEIADGRIITVREYTDFHHTFVAVFQRITRE